jgi:hypothetical protein
MQDLKAEAKELVEMSRTLRQEQLMLVKEGKYQEAQVKDRARRSVGREARAVHLVRSFLAGKTYNSVEPKINGSIPLSVDSLLSKIMADVDDERFKVIYIQYMLEHGSKPPLWFKGKMLRSWMVKGNITITDSSYFLIRRWND